MLNTAELDELQDGNGEPVGLLPGATVSTAIGATVGTVRRP
jgi:hypothetical protein